MLKYKEFRIGDLFDSQNGNTDLKKEHINGKGFPVVSSGEANQGIIGNTDAEARIIKGNSITVDMFGTAFYRDFDYKMVTHARVFSLEPKQNISKNALLYIVSMLTYLKSIYSYMNMCSFNKIKDDMLLLPATLNDEPDYKYMEERIAELEQERIAELEQYLLVTGLDDYELTDEDKAVLSAKCNYKEFRIGNLFEKLKAPYKGNGKKQENVSKVQTDEFSLPLINCKYGNNGIMYYGREKDFTFYENVISIIYNGPPTEGKCYYQPKIGVFTDSYLIALKQDVMNSMSPELCLYLTGAIEKSIWKTKYSRMNKATWENKVENDMVVLPVTSTGEPDYDYMERYIRTQEKLVIANVVKFKDKIIETTKAIVGSEVC